MQSMAAKSDYYLIELGYPLHMDEIAILMRTDSGGKLQDFVPMPTKTTGGVEDHEGKHYSLRHWVGYVTTGTGSGAWRRWQWRHQRHQRHQRRRSEWRQQRLQQQE